MPTRIIRIFTFVALFFCAAEAQKIAHVLVTGFGPFLQYTTNPSMKVALQLGGTTALFNDTVIIFDSVVLSVNHDGAQYVSHYLKNLAPGQPFPYDAVVHMGLYSGSNNIHVETVGANILADSANLPIFSDGQPFLPVTANLQDIQIQDLVPKELQDKYAGKRLVEWSRDAGNYYCNETLYRTLAAIRFGISNDPNDTRRTQGGRLIPAVFVHLPDENVSSIQADAAVIQRVCAALVNPALVY